MVLFHLVDGEILDLHGAKEKFRNSLVSQLEKDLHMLLAILPADEVVVISPTFLFEESICEEIMRNNMALIEEGYIALLMREGHLRDFNSKKQEGYQDVTDIKKYKAAYFGKRVKQLENIPFDLIAKNASIGVTSFRICIELLEEEREKCGIDQKLFDEIIKQLIETQTVSFLWESVIKQLNKSNVPPNIIRKLRIRQVMSQSYLEAYQAEGIALAQDNKIYTHIRDNPNACVYNLLKIDRILTLLEVKDRLLSMTAKELCNLKQDKDYVLTISKVHELLQAGLSTEKIIEELHHKKIDIEIDKIMNRVKEKHNLGAPILDLEHYRKECNEVDKHIVCQNEGRNCMKKNVLILTALKKELNAVLSGFGLIKPVEQTINGRTYYIYDVQKQQIICTSAFGMGQMNAALALSEALNAFSEINVVILTGICAGIHESVNLGDLIISDQIVDYELGKIVEEDEIIRWNVYRSSAHLLDGLKNFHSGNGQNQEVHYGTVLSGNKVIANKKAIDRLSRVWDKCLGLEMEGAGVAATIYQRQLPPEFIMIKSVCDRADASKDDTWQETAAQTAAIYSIDFILNSNYMTTPYKAINDKDIANYKLRCVISELYSKGELNVLAFDIGIDIENIPGDTKTEKVVELIKHCERVKKVSVLIDRVNEQRDNILGEM